MPTPMDDISIVVGKGVKVVFSHELMLQVATGKFSKSIEQLSSDLAALIEQQPVRKMVDGNEEDDETPTE